MPIIKNIGEQQRMVVDRYLSPGDARYISPKRVDGFQGDPDFEIVDETPKSSDQHLAISSQPVLLKVQIVDDEPLQAKAEVVPEADASTTSGKTARSPLSAKGKRGKKK